MRKIGFGEIGMFQQRNKHGRHAVKRRNLFIIDTIQRGLWRIIGQRINRHAMCHRRRHCQHHTETMEHRHLNHHTVGGRQIHSVTDTFTVVHNIVVG